MIPFLLPALGAGIGSLFGTAAPVAAGAAAAGTGAAAAGGIGSLLGGLGGYALPLGMMGASVVDRLMAPDPGNGSPEKHPTFKYNVKQNKRGKLSGGYIYTGDKAGSFRDDVRMYAEGGLIEDAPSASQDGGFDPMQAGIASLTGGGGQSATRQVDKQIVQQAFMALTGQIPQEQPLAMFVKRFGKPALADLAKRVVEMEGQNDQGMMVSGPGDGLSDSIDAKAGAMTARLSDGEVVIPADVVSGLGNGSTQAGAKELMNMVRRARQERHGSSQQPPAINPQELMPI